MLAEIDLPAACAYVAAFCWIAGVSLFAVFLGANREPRP